MFIHSFIQPLFHSREYVDGWTLIFNGAEITVGNKKTKSHVNKTKQEIESTHFGENKNYQHWLKNNS